MNIITGIASGVASAAASSSTRAVNAAKDALNWVKDKLGIHSPSRVFRDQVGVMIGRGAWPRASTRASRSSTAASTG